MIQGDRGGGGGGKLNKPEKKLNTFESSTKSATAFKTMMKLIEIFNNVFVRA